MRSSNDKNFSSSSSLRVVASLPYLATAIEKGFKLALFFFPASSGDGACRSKGLGDIERDENIITNRFI
jgi:hypothetical protein